MDDAVAAKEMALRGPAGADWRQAFGGPRVPR